MNEHETLLVGIQDSACWLIREKKLEQDLGIYETTVRNLSTEQSCVV